MSKTYFWKEGGVLVSECQHLAWQPSNLEILSCPCVDLFHDDPQARYGMFTKSNRWEHIPLEKMPKAFLTTLLIMGVTI